MILRFEQVVPAPIDAVFGFYAEPAHLTRLLRDWPRFRLLSCDSPLRVGARLWVQELFFAIPVAMGFRCHVCEPPHRIGGRMFHGPFERFEHLHTFKARGPETRVVDQLDVAVPTRFGGAWTMRRLVEPLLRRAFASRQRELMRIAIAGRLGDPVDAGQRGTVAIAASS